MMISSITQKEKEKAKKSKHNKKWSIQEEEEENTLSSYFFGSSATDTNLEDGAYESTTAAPTWHDDDDDDDDVDGDKEEQFNNFVIDRKGDGQQLTQYESSDEEEQEILANKQPKKQTLNEIAAWQDDDDDDTHKNKAVNLLHQSKRKKLRHSEQESTISIQAYEGRLRTRYKKTFTNTDWARNALQQPSRSSILSSTESMLQTTSTGGDKVVVPLPANQLTTIRHPDVNRDYNMNQAKSTTVQVVQFYRGDDPSLENNPLLFTAGLDQMLNFYRINSTDKSMDEEASTESSKVSGFLFKNFPIRSASFLGNSPNVILSSRRSYLHVYDAIAGKVDIIPKIRSRQEKSYERIVVSPNGCYIAILGNDGYILLMETKTKQLIQTFKINGTLRCVTFHSDSTFLFASGSDGDIYRFELRYPSKHTSKFSNEDGTTVHSLQCFSTAGEDMLQLAVGSESGVVNLYTLNQTSTSPPALSKSFMNLKTSITNIQTNSHQHSSILGISSSFSRDGLRLIHAQSQTVFANWPTRNTPLGNVFGFDFSQDSRYLAIGNDKGKCLLYELLHFSS